MGRKVLRTKSRRTDIFEPASVNYRFRGLLVLKNIKILTKKLSYVPYFEIIGIRFCFKDWMSNKLPVGSKIFFAKERGDMLLVEANGVIVKYLAIVEG
ncbi:hypothetical protein HF078_14625 [Bacillus sp. RO2]|uniref:hypothetical protein n=1 Tax=Bacillus sp. RO2 TaxID=2723913 RepID=UPI00145EFA47|nr:hypothetical protein [Bacillus sp. RO2]NMH74323.1 hypothetical protein [Bacillus sp. RO2]